MYSALTYEVMKSYLTHKKIRNDYYIGKRACYMIKKNK